MDLDIYESVMADAREIAEDMACSPRQPSDRDRAWIASNLGDVPMRIFDTVTNVTLTTVESLGRES